MREHAHTGGPGAPGKIVLWLLVLLPVTTWLPLATTSVQAAMWQSPLLVYSLGMLLLLAAWIGQDDRTLGGLVAWHVLALTWTLTPAAFETTELLALSALAVCAVRRLPASLLASGRRVLVGMGLFQAAYVLLQRGGVDLFWQAGMVRGSFAGAGTLSSSNLVGFYLAVVTPLAPPLLVPVFLAGLVASKCLTGLAAAVAGLCWVHRRWWRWLLPIGLTLCASLIAWKGTAWTSGLMERLDFWRFALERMFGWEWLIGRGPGAWMTEIPTAQVEAGLRGPELMLQAHSEWLQMLYETGVVSIGLAAACLWSWRAMFAGPYGGACVAILIGSLTLYGFRMAVTGAVIVFVLGAATVRNQRAV